MRWTSDRCSVGSVPPPRRQITKETVVPARFLRLNIRQKTLGEEGMQIICPSQSWANSLPSPRARTPDRIPCQYAVAGTIVFVLLLLLHFNWKDLSSQCVGLDCKHALIRSPFRILPSFCMDGTAIALDHKMYKGERKPMIEQC